jgi:hypothetical protein
VHSVGEALEQANAQAMLVPPAADFPHAGLRTVAFRSSAWGRAAVLTPPLRLRKL